MDFGTNYRPGTIRSALPSSESVDERNARGLDFQRKLPTECWWKFCTTCKFRIPLLAPIGEPIIGKFFIQNIANKTLRCMKAYLESQGKHGSRLAMSRRRAVITGIGPITCIGRGRENFWRGIRAEKSGIVAISTFDTSGFHAHCAGEIRDWMPEDFFPPHRLKRLDRYAQFSVASTKIALDDAGIPYSRRKIRSLALA